MSESPRNTTGSTAIFHIIFFFLKKRYFFFFRKKKVKVTKLTVAGRTALLRGGERKNRGKKHNFSERKKKELPGEHAVKFNDFVRTDLRSVGFVFQKFSSFCDHLPLRSTETSLLMLTTFPLLQPFPSSPVKVSSDSQIALPSLNKYAGSNYFAISLIMFPLTIRKYSKHIKLLFFPWSYILHHFL